MTLRRSLQLVSMATAVIASLWFYTATLDPFNITKLAVLVVGGMALLGLLAGGAKLWWSKDEWLFPGVLGLFVLGLSLAAIASPQDAYRTLWGAWARNDGWIAYTALAVIMLAVGVAFRGANARFGAYSLAAVGVVEIIYSTMQTFGADPVEWNNSYNAILGTVGNPNFASALLGIAGVVFCWMALEHSHGMVVRAGSAVLAVWALWLTWRSDAIQGTLAFAAGLALLIGGWLSVSGRRGDLRRLTAPYFGLVGLGGVLGVAGLAGAGPLAGLLNTQNLLNRKFYWKTAWNMFTSQPLFGVGLDSMGDYYRLYRSYDSTGMPGVDVTTNAAHSILFQTLATGGVAFAGTYILIQAFVVWRGAVVLRSGEHRLLISGLGGAWIAFQLQSLFSIDQLGLTVWGWVLGGLIIGMSYAGAPEPTPSKVKRRAAKQQDNEAMPALVAGALLALIAIPIVGSPLAKDQDIRTISSFSVDRTNTAVVNATITEVQRLVAGADDPYWRATAVGKLYEIGAVKSGLALAEESARMFPNDITLWNLVAIAYEQTGNSAQAVEARAHTVALDPLNSSFADLLKQDKAAAKA